MISLEFGKNNGLVLIYQKKLLIFVFFMKTNQLYDSILAQRDPSQVKGLMRFFKTGKGQYGEGDQFLGIKVPVTREVVKQCWQEVGFDELETCIASEYHEMRLAALLTLIQIFKHAKKDKALQQQCIDFYLAHTQYINNWDLVDLSCYELLGNWLLDKDRSLLYDLARNGKTIWEQRIGMVSTMQFLRHGQLDDTYAIAEIFLAKPKPLHDLLQKAVGWLLREAGKRDEERLKEWLSTHHQAMPRTMWRYAIEKLPAYSFRHATMADLPLMLRLRDQAREIMRSYGNVNQWPEGYPPQEKFEKDIELGCSYMMNDLCGTTVATFAMLPGPDPTYAIVYDGQWLNDAPYLVVHRIASTPESHGVLDAILDFCEAQATDIRIDTHADNIVMINGLKKRGYQYCGIIHLLNGDERLAFQKTISTSLS